MAKGYNPSGDPHGVDRHHGAHAAGEAAGKVIGGGVGVLVGLALILLFFGPLLWAPLLAGLGAARLTPGTWQPWLAGFVAAALAVFIQFLLLVQKSPLLRYPAVALFSIAWVGGLWLELTSPPHDWLTTAPTWHAPGPWAWALIGLGVVVYAGLYLLALSRFGKGRWAKRWQLLR